MTPTARTGARTCASVLGLTALGVVLLGAPAFALDLPSAPPVLGTAASALPAPVATLLPAPVASLIPTPVASALDPITSKLPDASPSPTAKPKPQPAPAPRSESAAPSSPQQHGRSVSGIAPLPATLALSAGRADLPALAGVLAPVALAPVPLSPQLAPTAVTPQLAPAAVAAPAALPGTGAATQGLPAVVLALAIGAVSAVAAGQVAEMHARRTATA